MDRPNSSGASAPARISCSDWPAQSRPKPGGSFSATIRDISFIASPEL
jgi:hypothetical protein